MFFGQMDAQEESFIHDGNHEKILLARYDHANQMMLAIVAGDEKKVMEHLLPALESVDEVDRLYPLNENAVRQMRNRLISLNTTFTICANYGGVHPLHLHSISRRFDRKIEGISTRSQESLLLKEMAESYCTAVCLAQTEHFGDFSNQVTQIILSNLLSPPSLEEIAGQMNVASATVSRRFKTETGMTIPEFTNRFRIRLAKLYMRENTANLSEIAHSVGFSDASYFSKIFLRYTGMTPTEYTKALRASSPDSGADNI